MVPAMAGTFGDLDDWTEAEEAEVCALLATMEAHINEESDVDIDDEFDASVELEVEAEIDSDPDFDIP